MANAIPMTFAVQVDWAGDGSFATVGDDITAYVKQLSTLAGMMPDSRVAAVGMCDITLHNADRRFSPLNSSSPYYGKMVPNKSVRVQITDGATTWTLWRGFTRAFTPTPGVYGPRNVALHCEDLMAPIQGAFIGLPLQTNIRSDVLAKNVVNSALRAPLGTQTVTIAVGNLADGNTVGLFDSTMQTTVMLTSKTTLSGAADEVLIGASNMATAQNLADAINRAQGGAGVTYATTISAWPVTASVVSNVVTLTAKIRGTVSANYTLTSSGVNITLGGPSFVGGVDYPVAPAPSYSTGKQTFADAADTWDGATNAMTALDEIANAEQGWIWMARDGTLTFKNMDYAALAIARTSMLTLSSQFNGAAGTLDDADIFNHVTVSYAPRSTIASGVVAKNNSVITVPGASGTDRYNPAFVPGQTMVRLSLVDPATGQPMSVQSLVLPLVAGTDFQVSTDSAGTLGDYTYSNNVIFSTAVNGTNLEVSMRNTASGPLYVSGLKVRGVGLVRYNSTTAFKEDATSEDAYGKKAMTVDLKISSTGEFAAALAAYYLSRYKDPYFRISTITFDKQNVIGGVNLFGLEIGDVITITDAQMAVAAQKYMITGVAYSGIGPKEPGTIAFNVFRLDDKPFGQWDNATYGPWDTAIWWI